ncbi:hypothetical protein [Paraburkholderia tagetis]|uniref:Outer membrane protein beta-barrel domain-containing protein n=1 Tax=Paraburkholderia tagetis TaxID=2913261 RepID=A0A9X1UDP0_9BURK|nr:hypothetical protein [Paraburkholderia tagetis]MCG5072295.1 hypothetical protein [Paraburkholderia tagetis]
MTLGCAAASQAHAEDFFQVEAGIGGAAYQHGANGLWFQDGFQHRFDLTAPAIEAGFTGDIYQSEHWGISWHADWAWLGTIHTQALATPDDANYNPVTKGCNGKCWPLANYLGSGHDMGILLTLEPHYDYGGWRFGVEGGPYIHRSTWTEDVIGWVPSPDATPMNVSVHNNPKWRLGWVIGASVGYKNFSVSYQYFKNGTPVSSSDHFPSIWSNTHVLMARWRF